MKGLTCRNLSLSIGKITVCRNLDLSIAPGQCWGILGQNGAGKTTLLHTLANLRQPDGGEILLNDQPLRRWPRRRLAQTLGLLSQDVEDPFPATVLETALIGRHPHTPAWRMESAEDVAAARAALADVVLDELADRQVSTLSGGERQRLGLASILAQAPDFFLLDEPTNHLDLHYQVSLLQLFHKRTREHDAAVLMTLHDINLAARFCDYLILLLGNGELVHGETQHMLREDYLQRVYGHRIVQVESSGRRAYLPE